MISIRRAKDHIQEDMTYFPVLAIVGPRQVGKTTLAKTIQAQLGITAEYLDLENPRDLAKLTDPLLFLESHSHHCLILDEIQRLPSLFPILRSVVDSDRRPGRFLLLGSASPNLIRDASESLAGRIAYTELTPFLWEEIQALTSMKTHWFRGGFPDALLAPSDRLVERWHTNFVQTYLERDLPLLGLPAQPSVLRRLWTMIAHIHGQIVNRSTLANSLDLSIPTISRYLQFLEEAFLIRTLPPFHSNLGKRLVKSPKVYIRDSGVLHHLHGINTESSLDSHPILGNSWEGYVIEQILPLRPSGMDASFYRTQDGTECDLVLSRASNPEFCVEIKYSSAPKCTRSLTQAIMDLKPKASFIIIPGSEDYMLKEGLRVCGLAVFLEKYLRG